MTLPERLRYPKDARLPQLQPARCSARDPGNTDWQRGISISLGRMADTLLQMHRQAEARPLAERALKLLRAAVARFPNDPRLSRNMPYYEDLFRRAGGTP
jgi:hypothetical protein